VSDQFTAISGLQNVCVEREDIENGADTSLLEVCSREYFNLGNTQIGETPLKTFQDFFNYRKQF